MIVHELELNQFRGFQKAALEFVPGFNLLVGENGAGKSTVLWALRVALSHILHKTSLSKQSELEFLESDVANSAAIEWPFLTATLEFNLSQNDSTRSMFFAQRNRRQYVTGEAGKPREQVVETPDRYEFVKYDLFRNLQSTKPPRVLSGPRPLAVYYSANRSLVNEKPLSKSRTLGNEARAYAEALLERPSKLSDMADLWRKEDVLREEGVPDRANQAIQKALPEFLEGFNNLRLDEKRGPQLTVDKEGARLNLTQISDGERSLLTMLMDLTRRLALANPGLKNPALEASAVVLIDEIDLHLHPRWQRTIVKKLTRTFPKCQFIATTHSPQVIGEVPSGEIIVLEYGKPPYRPTQSLGMDSNWVLRFVMDSDERNLDVDRRLKRIATWIEKGKYEQAKKAIDALRSKIGEFPGLVQLQTRIDKRLFLSRPAPSKRSKGKKRSSSR